MLLRIPKRFWTKRKKIYTVIPGRLRAARYLYFHKHKKRSRSPLLQVLRLPFCLWKFKLLHHACNFRCEVVSTLLQTLALDKAGELDDLDLAAQVLSDLSGVLSNGQVAILDELLIDQAVLLEELLDLALDHLLPSQPQAC